MKHKTPSSADLFPCPFCQSSDVKVIGQGRVFMHYRCGNCSENWTGVTFPPPRVKARSALDEALQPTPYMFH